MKRSVSADNKNTDVKPRTERTLTGNITVLPEGGAIFTSSAKKVTHSGDVDDVNELLGEHTDETPRVVASGGGIIEAGDESEVFEQRALRQPRLLGRRR